MRAASIVLLLSCVVAALARPQNPGEATIVRYVSENTGIDVWSLARPQNPGEATIVRYVSENTGIDGYNFEYETSDGVIRTEKGVLQNAGTENEIMQVTGSVTWTDNEGTKHTINFTADENGYKPVIS